MKNRGESIEKEEDNLPLIQKCEIKSDSDEKDDDV